MEKLYHSPLLGKLTTGKKFGFFVLAHRTYSSFYSTAGPVVVLEALRGRKNLLFLYLLSSINWYAAGGNDIRHDHVNLCLTCTVPS